MKSGQRRWGTRGKWARFVVAMGLSLGVLAITAAPASAAAPTILSVGVSEVTTSSATLEASINPNGKETRYHFEYGTTTAYGTSVPSTEGTIPAGSSPVTVKAPAESLSPGTVYHFRVLARNGITAADKATSADHVFATRAVPPTGLPDGRAYEQASPVDKDGGDAIGIPPQLKTSPEGDAITFGSTVGIPGGVGAQEVPLYLARRGTEGWSTRGLLPPPSAGQRAHVVGWLPGFAEVFSAARRIADPETGALLASGPGGSIEELTPYAPNADYTFLGGAGQGSEVVFESNAALGSPPGIEDASNVYALDRESGAISLVSVDNEGHSLPHGAFGGSYDWAVLGTSPTNLSQGGAARNYYSQDQHVVAADGAVFFTEAASGQLYERLNPTQPQSELDGEGKCKEPQKACTLHVSESRRTTPDPAEPAAFMGAAADGSAAYFTSPEKLTEDANTGPPQPEPKIGRSDINGTPASVEEGWLAGHRAVGVAVDSKYIYWADPVDGAIGRAELNGGNADDEFITPGPTTVEEQVENPPNSEKFETVTTHPLSHPRYVAVGAGQICWTNTADGKNEHGTIGCATINPVTEEPEDIHPECITGASNPQGIAMNAEHIYWANSGTGDHDSIGRAETDCTEANQVFQATFGGAGFIPQGLALSSTHIYATVENQSNSYLQWGPIDGGESPQSFFIGPVNGIRGLAVDSTYAYWASQGGRAIGRVPLGDVKSGIGGCPATPTCEPAFIELEGAPSGLAVEAEHIYWSTNGETLPSPGNDLYRFAPDGEGGGTLTDLTPDASDKNGAEVQGVVGVSEDGSRVYFTANADLDGAGPAQAGNCQGPFSREQGRCNLYLWHDETTSFVARLNTNLSALGLGSDVANWAPTTSAGNEDEKTAFLSAGDGATLLFRSQEQLSGYDNKGVSELYLYREGEPIVCISCNPSGEAPKGRPTLSSITPAALQSIEPASLASRHLSADGARAFFETNEALVTSDTNGDGEEGCPQVGSLLQKFPACQDVYEWEAPGSPGCPQSSPSYSPLNAGCLYLISTGKDDYASFFADASADGDNVFFFTRQGLVGQDKDELLDAYDARVDGGLPAQSPVSVPPCEGTEACHGPVGSPPAEGQPTSQAFVGPGNAVPKHTQHKKSKKHKKHKVKKKHKHKHHHQRRANAGRRAGR